MTEEAAVKSPCISICALNDEDICEGCYRSTQEITDWTALTNPQKEQVLLKVNERFKALNKHLLL